MSTEATYQLYVENGLYKMEEKPCQSEEEAIKKSEEFPTSKIIFDEDKLSCVIYTPNENVTQSKLLQLLSEANYDESCRQSNLLDKQLHCQSIIKNILIFFCALATTGLVIWLINSLNLINGY